MATEPSLRDQAVHDSAVHWAVQTADPAFTDWDGFTRWLEADPAHGAAYDRVAASVADVTEAGIPEAAPVLADIQDNVVPLVQRRGIRRAWLGGAIAASLALVTTIGVWQLRDRSQTFETAPGEIREFALADGSAITLGGDTRLRLADENSREVALEQGQALFTVHHDEARPFRVSVGDDTLVDVGTVFDVRRSAGTTTVAVSEGAVVFNPAAQNLRIDPGQQLVRHDGSDRIERSAVPLALVGEWREGRLTFRDVPLSQIASDLSRASGIAFAASPDTASRRVSGSVLVDPIRRDPASLGPLLGLSVRRAGQGWSIEP